MGALFFVALIAALLDVTASEPLVSVDEAKAGDRRASHVQPTWNLSCATRGSRSVIAFRMRLRRS